MTRYDQFREWDAAYVLGSLSPDERMRYERHLEGCPGCRAAVAELAGMPALLSKVSAPEVESLERPESTVVDLLPALVSRVARHRRRNRLLVAAALLLALAAAFIVPSAAFPPGERSQTASEALQLTRVNDSPLTVSVRMAEQQWGTRFDLECTYAGGGSYGSADYALFVTAADGSEVEVVTWASSPGQTAWPSGTTSVPASAIQAVEVRQLPSGLVLLRGSP